jgi:hypothetical protein
MSAIPTSVTENQFDVHIEPHLRVAKRGYVSKIPLSGLCPFLRSDGKA